MTIRAFDPRDTSWWRRNRRGSRSATRCLNWIDRPSTHFETACRRPLNWVVSAMAMSRLLQTSLAAGVILALLVAGNIWFHILDDRRSEAFRFALFEPENVLKEITASAEASKNLSGSGKGVAVPCRPS